MSQSLGNKLPPELAAKLDQGALFRPGGVALAVLTTDDGGWPHVAMAPGAIAGGTDVVWFALGSNSRSLENARRSGQITLVISAPDTLYYIKGQAEIVRPAMQVMEQEAALRLAITDVLSDVESFVSITGGITYRYNLMHDDFVQVIGALLDELQGLADAT